MQNLVPVYKPIGVTPLETVQKFKLAHPEFAHTKIGYAGRLDPLAHGVLLLMIGEETKKRETYLALQKSYEFQTIFGLQTDTYDILGLLNETKQKTSPKNVNLIVNTFVNKHLGKQVQFYPPYSSKTVEGKPLFWWARNGKLSKIEIPTREIEIVEFKVSSIDEITNKELKPLVYKSIHSVIGDFRQKEIENRWNIYFSQSNSKEVMPKITFKITCSSGTYIRELVNQMGREVGCGAIAIDILRSAVGNYSLVEAQKL